MGNIFDTGIDVKSNLSFKEFDKNYYNRCTPVVIPDATKQWDAHKKWSIKYLSDNFGTTAVKVDGKIYLLSDFLEMVEKSTEESPAPYLNEVNVLEAFPGMMKDLVPEFIYTVDDRLKSKLIPAKLGMRHGCVELLIGGKGAHFPVLHYDGYHHQTFITQIRGDKEFYMISPDQTSNLYVEDKYTNKSPVNFFNPDFKKYPLFRNVKAQMIVVKEGETIYIPSGWWHTTRLLSTSVAVSINSMNHNMWNTFVDDFAHMHFQNPAKRTLFKTYMSIAGKIMDISGKS